MARDEFSEISDGAYAGSHGFLSKELLIPHVDKCDANRINMFDSHLEQALVLKEGEFPRVFTGFENKVGRYSSSYLKADRAWTVIDRVVKNDQNSVVVLRDEKGYVDAVWSKPAEILTEYFGYRYVRDVLDSLSKGDQVNPGTVLRRSTAYDADLNLRFGVNLKAIYIPWKGMTYI